MPLTRETYLEGFRRALRIRRSDERAVELVETGDEHGFPYLRAPIIRVATPDIQIPYSPGLEKGLYPTKERTVSAIRTFMGTAPGREA